MINDDRNIPVNKSGIEKRLRLVSKQDIDPVNSVNHSISDTVLNKMAERMCCDLCDSRTVVTYPSL